MDIDLTTYEDLSVFNRGDDYSIFQRLDFTRTLGGKERLLRNFNEPFSDLRRITETQKVLSIILEQIDSWPQTISNGTIMVMERFYETALDEIPDTNHLSALTYKIFHGPDFSLLRYSLDHFADFVRGMNQIIAMFDRTDCPAMLHSVLQRAASLLNQEYLHSLNKSDPRKKFSPIQTVYFGYNIRNRFKSAAEELITIYGRLDAWYSMAMATKTYGLCFPRFLNQDMPHIDAKSLYHILLPEPVSYDVQLNQEMNFIFLTGANMAGKSTFIKAIGTAVFLAHLGMGVPAKEMELSVFDGILSNINVVDNIAKGESYFYNEVQRIKNTIIKINDSHKWLVLIDELFKGTNVQDAMKCSSTVIKGLIKIKNSLFILSTHLYEIGEELKQYPNICFKYFETSVHNDQLDFSFQLKSGISNDRLGYLILKREKVVELLDKL